VSRTALTYGDRAIPRRFDGIDVTEPKAGFYRARLVSGGVRGGVRLFYGPPKDPITGEELDRSWRWQAEFDGEPVEFDRAWPVCAGEPITEAEYRRYCQRKTWAESNAPQSAYADRRKRLDPLDSATPLPF
jgi:hypothetical protein